MQMTGEYRIPAPQTQVWAALNDPEILKASIPGCDHIEKASDTEMSATVTAKVGPVKASFKGQVTLSDLDPPNSYRISGKGSGGVAGFAEGEAKVSLSPDGDGTLMKYEVKATVGGKLAQIGQRLIDATAKKMADDFFATFATLAAGPAPAADGESAPAAEAAGTTAKAAQAGAGLPPVVWIGGLVAIVLALTVFFASR